MSNGEFYAFVGLLVACGLMLGLLAVLGLDQRPATRIADGVVAAGYLGGATYLLVTETGIPIYSFAVVVPALLLLIQLLRERGRARRRRLAAGLTSMYVSPAASTPLTPFPAPPPPLESSRRDEPARPAAPRTYRPMPSGLPPRGDAAPPPPPWSSPSPPSASPPASPSPPPPASPSLPAHSEPTWPGTSPGLSPSPGPDRSGLPRRPAYPDAPEGRHGGGRHQSMED
ncbi:hypothetical protein ODJ79_02655 [Actinoplanes sp. KI2]|uniref:hypothetical protein n=1 Tax=Actinoplanes sp. KI2 TaxID=2983315 RepID=UPI0021D590DB|nr:hypothetical protein [Actinoplanes sp. KI2]MCU7722607.1 hypothetical protein [Actinoplanes sp. KI2]